jgi:hypothetical protein
MLMFVLRRGASARFGLASLQAFLAAPIWWAVCVLLLAAAALFHEQVFFDKVLSSNDIPLLHAPFSRDALLGERPDNPLLGDAAYVFHPDLLAVRESLRGFDLPLWMSEVGAGRPLLASQQSAPLYPLTWLVALLPFWDSLVIVAIAKLVIAGLGTYALCRYLSLRPLAATLGGLSYAFCAYFVTWLQHPHTNAYSLFPWLLLLVHVAVVRQSLPAATGMAAIVALLFLGGHPQSAVLMLMPGLLWGAFLLLRLARNRDSTGKGIHIIWRGSVILGAATALGVLASALALLPFIELLREAAQQSRASPPVEAKVLATLFFPEFWGRSDATEFLGPLNYQERTAYLGAVPVLLALFAIPFSRRGVRWCFVGLGALAAIAAVDLGPLTHLLRSLPPLDRIGVHRALVLVCFSIAILAAIGMEALLERRTRHRRAGGFLLLAVVALPVVAIMASGVDLDAITAGFRHLPALERPIVSADIAQGAAAARWMLFASLSALVLYMLLNTRLLRVGAPAIVGLLAIDLVSLNVGYHTALPRLAASPPQPAAVEAIQREVGSQRFAGLGNALGPNLAISYGLRDARAHDLPVPARYFELWNALGGTVQSRALIPPDSDHDDLLDLFGASLVMSSADSRKVTHAPIFSDDVVTVERNGGALPRAFVAIGSQPARNKEHALNIVLENEASDLLHNPVIENSTASSMPRPVRAATPAVIVDDQARRVVVRFESPQAGHLVLLDSFYPGWRATLDGRDAQIMPANVAFRAVAVPAGSHEVIFTYEPMSVRVGLWVTVLSLATMVILFLFGFRRIWLHKGAFFRK